MSQPDVASVTVTFRPDINLHDLEKALTQMDAANKGRVIRELEKCIERAKNRVRQTGA